MAEEADTLAELFARDPAAYSDQDIDKIIARMRTARHQFNAGDRTAGKVKSKTDPVKKAQAEDFLKDLGI